MQNPRKIVGKYYIGVQFIEIVAQNDADDALLIVTLTEMGVHSLEGLELIKILA